MNDPTAGSPAEQIVALLERDDREGAVARLEEEREAPVDERKAMLRSIRMVAGDRPAVVAPLAPALAAFLRDEERPVRLTAAKLLVALAEATPGAVVPTAPALADRLADEEAFYYVRARAAEALGYVALEHPDAVDDPEILADLRIGLAFDEPEVKEKLAKALEYVALGDPNRLRHQVSSLAEHLDDGNELVRYHLATALVAIGCESPERLAPVHDELVGGLEDENDHVRGRAAEALGLLAREQSGDDAPPDELSEMMNSEDERFVVERVRFALGAMGQSDTTRDVPDTVGTREGVRNTTAGAAEEIASPDGDGMCPQCGLELPEGAPPMCPRCGTPVPDADRI